MKARLTKMVFIAPCLKIQRLSILLHCNKHSAKELFGPINMRRDLPHQIIRNLIIFVWVIFVRRIRAFIIEKY